MADRAYNYFLRRRKQRLQRNAVAPAPVGPALSLPFSAMTPAQIAAAGVTAPRSGLAWQYDATGKITTCPNNLLLRSEEMDSVSWSKNNCTATPNTTVDPNGSATADTVAFTGVANARIDQTYSAVAGQRYIVSYWIMLLSGTAAYQIYESNTNTFSAQVATGSWQRVSYAFTAATTASAFIRIVQTSATASFAVWGAQLEAVTYETSPRTYNPTTSAAYYGPRLDYDPVTLAAKGLLVEEARTNKQLYSQDFTGGNWSKYGDTLSHNNAVGPDGTQTAALWTCGAASGDHCLLGNVTYSGSIETFSAYIKPGTARYVTLGQSRSGAAGYFSATFDLQAITVTQSSANVSSFSGASIYPVGNGYFRLTVSGTTSAGQGGFTIIEVNSIGTFTPDAYGRQQGSRVGTETIYLWGTQLELGAFATSYIPTTTASVTRAADPIPSVATGAWYNAAAGTFVIEASSNGGSGSAGGLFVVSDGTNNNRMYMAQNVSGTALSFGALNGGVVQASGNTLGTTTPGQRIKSALAYAANDFAAVSTGGSLQTDNTFTPPTVNVLNLAGYSTSGGTWLNGHIRQFDYYNTRKPDAELLSLVA